MPRLLRAHLPASVGAAFLLRIGPEFLLGPMRRFLTLALLTFLTGPSVVRAAQPVVLDLWPGKTPGQAAEPGKDTINRSRDGNVRLTNVTRPQVHIARPVKCNTVEIGASHSLLLPCVCEQPGQQGGCDSHASRTMCIAS